MRREYTVAIHSKRFLRLNFFRCEGTYSFIGNGIGKGKTITYADAWKGIHINDDYGIFFRF